MFNGKTLTIVHIVEDMSPVSGGVATVVKLLSEELSNNNLKHIVVCNKAEATVLSHEVILKIFKPSQYDIGWGYSREANDYLRNLSGSENIIFHIHGVWKATHYFAAKISRENNTPCIMTTHAMLDPWFWSRQGWLKRLKKNLYWSLFSHEFKKLKFLHAITPSESINLKTLLPFSERVVIPNTMLVPWPHEEMARSEKKHKYFLFIGRIDSQKGLDILIKAYLSSDIRSSIKLKIMGPIGNVKYWHMIKKYIAVHDVLGSIEYIGSKFGLEKNHLIKNAWCCTLPSRREVIGMVNLESASLKCPSITTFETGLHDWEDGGGLLIKAEDELSCKRALEATAKWSDEDRTSRGEASFDLLYNKYNISKIKSNWHDLYRKVMTD